jgi:hypothetical protein
LAAARIKLLSPPALLERLQESSLALLTSGAHDLPARQQTLRSAIQWGYDLLNAGEQRTFRSLGNRRGMAEWMAGLAGLRARQGKAEWCAVLLSAAETVLKVTGGAWWPADRVEVEANQAFIRSALGEAEIDGIFCLEKEPINPLNFTQMTIIERIGQYRFRKTNSLS